MNVTLEPHAYARCLAAFVEREQLRDELAQVKAHLAAAHAELERLRAAPVAEQPEEQHEDQQDESDRDQGALRDVETAGDHGRENGVGHGRVVPVQWDG